MVTNMKKKLRKKVENVFFCCIYNNMIKIPTALEEIVAGNPLLEFGISHRLFNLTQLAKFIQPMVEVRVKKHVQSSAIVMNLSRFQRRKKKSAFSLDKFRLDHISIESHLATMSFASSQKLYNEIVSLHNNIRLHNGFFSFTEGQKQITIFFEKGHEPLVEKSISCVPVYKNMHIACVGVRFNPKFFHIPGLLSILMQTISLQNVSLVEVSSTFTEFNFFVENKDVKVVFETLHDCFLHP